MRKIALEKYATLQDIEFREAQKAQELYTPFLTMWDSMRTGAELSDIQVQEAVQSFQSTIELKKNP